MTIKHRSLEQIMICPPAASLNTVADCYAVLVCYEKSSNARRFKDYIAVPKANMYQSLHTTVIGPKGMAFEVQMNVHASDGGVRCRGALSI